MRNWLKIVENKAKNIGEIFIYGEITEDKWSDIDVTPQDIKAELDKIDGKPINMYINSPGGSVFAGFAIYNMLKRYGNEITGYVDGIAASIASVILMAAKKVIIPKNGMVMIHEPSAIAMGTSADMRKTADLLDRVREGIISTYQTRIKDKDKLTKMMLDETWMTGEEALKNGFADELISTPVKACYNGNNLIINGCPINLDKYKTFPSNKIKIAPDLKEFENRIKLIKLNQEVKV